VSIVRRSEALGYVLPVSNYDIYSLPLRTFVADILVSMAGHVATKLFLGEYWTGATGDFNNVRARLAQLAHYGYFGPPFNMQMGGTELPNARNEVVERFWAKLEDQTEQILAKHAAEVHAVAQALLERNDLTGKQCIQVIRAAAGENEPLDSEALLKALVEETMVHGKNGNGNGKSEKKAKPKRKATPKLKVKN
jgi:cell division protease FtsH